MLSFATGPGPWRTAVNRSTTSNGADEILEIVTPRTNSALLSAAEHLFSALTGHERSR